MNNLDGWNYYDGLLTGETLSAISDIFLSESYEVSIQQDEKTIKEYRSIGSHLTYDQFMRKDSLDNIKLLYKIIENEFIHLEPSEYPSYIKMFEYKIDRYIEKLSAYIKLKDFFISDLKTIKGEIQKHLNWITENPDCIPMLKQQMENEQTEINANKMKKSTETNITTKNIPAKKVLKIKWLAKMNILLTLFYDLLNGQDRNEPLIQADKNDIKDFLKANFVDADGNELSDSTITTLFTPSKEEKRANRGDRIELRNIKRK